MNSSNKECDAAYWKDLATTERAAREKAEHDCGLWQDTVVEYEDILRRCEGIFSFLHFTPENEPSWDDLPDMIMELRARAETAESTLATLRAELRQARRRERVVAIICGEGTVAQKACIKRCVNSSLDVSGDLDAAWSALHAAGLVEDEDASV